MKPTDAPVAKEADEALREIADRTWLRRDGTNALIYEALREAYALGRSAPPTPTPDVTREAKGRPVIHDVGCRMYDGDPCSCSIRMDREAKMRDALACVVEWWECECNNGGWLCPKPITNADGERRNREEHRQHVRRTVEEALR